MRFPIVYPQEFLSIQLELARRIAELGDDPLELVVIDHTLFRHLLDLRVTRQDTSDPLWQRFVSGLVSASDPEGWMYQVYLDRAGELRKRPSEEYDGFGCFYYAYPFPDTKAVRLHFSPRDESGRGNLSRERVEVRVGELRDLFRHVKESRPEAETVRGGSWMYNIEPYRTLFPPEYIASAKPVGYEVGFWALWGQFLRRVDKADNEAVSRFLPRLREQKTTEACLECFPYQVLRPECPIRVFYEFYAI